MRTSLLKEVEKHLESRKIRRRLQWAAVALGAVVIFATVYTLVLPAITMERETYCDQKEHEHSKECYTKVLTCEESELIESRKVLDCQLKQHSHTDECRDEDGNMICGYADFVVHSHEESCYDSDGRLVCKLPEIEEHTHTPECYTEEKTLVCSQQESEGHTHTDACYTERETGAYICGQEEGENHTHTDACREKVRELSCGQEEDGGHHHTDSCYETVKNYTCGKEEVILHKHNADCYETDENGQQQRICGKTEVLSHTHDESCFVQNPQEESTHKHTDECYKKELICGQEEHEHTDACFENPEEAETKDGADDAGNKEDADNADSADDPKDADDADASDKGKDADSADETDDSENADHTDQEGEPDDADSREEEKAELTTQCGREEHAHTDNCYSSEGEMVCGQEEHSHELTCYQEEAQAEVEKVISLIEALPGAAEVEQKMEEYGDTEEGESYYIDLVKQAAEAYSAYENLHDELKKFIDTESETFQVMRSLAEAYDPAALDETQEEYSSNLADFSPQVTIKNENGQTIGPGGTVTIGNSYSIDLMFEETADKQFKYAEEGEENPGFLTYQIPLEFEVTPVTNGQLKSDTGKTLGTYSITSDGLLKVQFLNVDEHGEPTADGKNFIDTSKAAWVSLHFDAVARLSGDGETTVIKWDGKAETTYNTDCTAEASIKKSAVEYVASAHIVKYKVEITNENGLIKNGTLTDQMDHNLSYKVGTMKVTDEKGNEVTGWKVTPTSTGFTLTDLPELTQGDKLIVTYEAKVNDSVYNGEQERYIADNTATFKGKNILDADITPATGHSKVTIDANLIQKQGEVVKITDKDGKEISVIKWTILVGDGSSSLGNQENGLVIVDELEGEQEFYDLEGSLECTVLIKFGYLNLKKGLVTCQVDSGNRKKVSITLPTNQDIYDAYEEEYGPKTGEDGKTIDGLINEAIDCDYKMARLTYYTKYTVEEDLNTVGFKNNAHFTFEGTDYGVTEEVDIVGAAPKVEKEKTNSTSKEIEYTVKVSVPGLLNGSFFYLADQAVFWNLNGTQGSTCWVDNDITIKSIQCVGKSGTEYRFEEYGSANASGADATYILANVPEYGNPGDREIVFNVAPDNLLATHWNIAEDSTLTIVYSIPKDAKAGQETKASEFDSTIEEVLSNRINTLSNYVLAYYMDGDHYVQGSAEHREQDYFKKEGEIKHNEDGTDTIDYEVVFNNFSDPSDRLNSLILPKGVTGVEFKDEYESQYLTFDTSTPLTVTVYNPSGEGEIWGRFEYKGNPDSDGDGVIRAPAGDFKKTNEDYEINKIRDTLAKWLQEGTPEGYDGIPVGTAPGIYKFTYTLKVNKEAINNAKLSSIPLNNTADIIYENKSVGEITNKLQYETGLIEKGAQQLYVPRNPSTGANVTPIPKEKIEKGQENQYMSTDTLEYTIELNKDRCDLIKDKGYYQVIDEMENLKFYPNTVKVEKNNGDTANPKWTELTMKLSQDKVTEDGDHYSLTFGNNVLKITVPDKQHIKITYQAEIVNKNDDVQTSNTASINGDTTMQDSTKAKYHVDQTSGSAGGGGFTLVKKNEYNEQLIPNVEFALYSSMKPEKEIPVPEGIDIDKEVTINMKEGTGTLKLYYIGNVKTEDKGSVTVAKLNDISINSNALYMLKELDPPAGYIQPAKDTVFYMQGEWADKVDNNNSEYDVKKVENGYLFVTNEPYGIELPKTGSFGVIRYTLAGVVLIGAAGLMYIKQIRKRRRVLRR